MSDAQCIQNALSINDRLLGNDVAKARGKELDCHAHSNIIGHAPSGVQRGAGPTHGMSTKRGFTHNARGLAHRSGRALAFPHPCYRTHTSIG